MAASNNVNAITIIELRAAIVVFGCDLGQTQVDIDFGEYMGRRENALGGMNRDICTKLYEELILHLIDALLGIEYDRFVFFQVGCEIAFGVGQRLAAHVVCWYPVQIVIAYL